MKSISIATEKMNRTFFLRWWSKNRNIFFSVINFIRFTVNSHFRRRFIYAPTYCIKISVFYARCPWFNLVFRTFDYHTNLSQRSMVLRSISKIVVGWFSALWILDGKKNAIHISEGQWFNPKWVCCGCSVNSFEVFFFFYSVEVERTHIEIWDKMKRERERERGVENETAKNQGNSNFVWQTTRNFRHSLNSTFFVVLWIRLYDNVNGNISSKNKCENVDNRQTVTLGFSCQVLLHLAWCHIIWFFCFFL